MKRYQLKTDKSWKRVNAFFIRFTIVGIGIILYNLISNDWQLTEKQTNLYLLFPLLLVAFYLVMRAGYQIIRWIDGLVEGE